MSANKISGVWKESLMNVIYTLTPTHCGTGQSNDAVDLPIARDVVTEAPVFPGSAIKGVVREKLENKFRDENSPEAEIIKHLLGANLEEQENKSNTSPDIAASALAFTEARLVLFPVRSLNRPFLWVTCPMILEKLSRDIKLLSSGINFKLGKIENIENRLFVSDKNLQGLTIVVEDLCYGEEEVVYLEDAKKTAEFFSGLLENIEEYAAKRIKDNLVIIPDSDFVELIKKGIPVIARTKLTKGKTTQDWKDPETGEVDTTGNLWYEEYLPQDCLLISFTGLRRQVVLSNNNKENKILKSPLKEFSSMFENNEIIQIGGNETIGNGLCLFKMVSEKGDK